MNQFTINNLTKKERAKAKQGGKTGRANMMWGGGKTGREDREGGQKQKKMERRTEAGYGIMKKEDDRIRYPPMKFLTKPI